MATYSYPTHFIDPTMIHPHQSVSPDLDDDMDAPESSAGKWKSKVNGHGEKEGPVKNACLSCRSKKAKCDGQRPICGQCVKKNLECVYIKSRRGGARKKREVVAPSALREFLARLDRLLQAGDIGANAETGGPYSDDTTNVVREFTSREEVLRCYYDEVHPFMALLPPRDKMHLVLPTLAPNSPFLLACQSIMILVPHPLDKDPKGANSKRLRRQASQRLAKQTMDTVEQTLGHQATIECVQALSLLGLWEWGSSGDLTATKSRAGQAIQVAMELGLHELDKHRMQGRKLEGEDWRLDMARRTWWQTYTHQIYASVVSGSTPVVGPDDPRIMVDFPVCSVDDSAWPNWVNTVRQCQRIITLVNAYYESVPGSPSTWGHSDASLATNRHQLKDQIIDIDRTIVDMLKMAESTALIAFVPGGEELVCRNQQMAARFGLAVVHIQVHRQQAFPEVSLFSKKICGLPVAPDFGLDEGFEGQPLIDQPHSQEPSFPLTVDTGAANVAATMPKISGWSDPDFELWDPDTYPSNLPQPWFVNHTAASLIPNPSEMPNWGPMLGGVDMQSPPTGAFIVPISPSVHSAMSLDGRMDGNGSGGGGRRRSISATPSSSAAQRPHKAWGVDEKDQTVRSTHIPEGSEDGLQVFPPGISLSRCALAAHTVVRLEVLHRSASIAMTHEPPKWMPFCSCGLVSGAYAFLLLALAVQAESTFEDREERVAEVEALLTNVKILLAALESYGVMWGGIDAMAGEVRAALEAATRLPYEVRAQIESISPSSSADQL